MIPSLALDVMGGDFAPHSVLEGASLALKKGLSCHFHLFGDEQKITPLLSQYPTLREFPLYHTPEFIPGDMKPLVAIRSLKQSSLRLAIESVAEGRCQAVVSSGNTGAYMALAKLILNTLKGVDRPAIAAKIPTLNGFCTALDLGANVVSSSDQLIQFAIMGHHLNQRLSGKACPTVALLNVGVEDQKGDPIVQEAFQFLKSQAESLNFIGFIEGDGIPLGQSDVIVTNGFTGNITLKAIEGTARLVTGVLKSAFASSFLGKLGAGIATSALQKAKARMDPGVHNGAVFLGLRSPAIKSHGSADGFAFSKAIEVALSATQTFGSSAMGEEIEKSLEKICGGGGL